MRQNRTLTFHLGDFIFQVIMDHPAASDGFGKDCARGTWGLPCTQVVAVCVGRMV